MHFPQGCEPGRIVWRSAGLTAYEGKRTEDGSPLLAVRWPAPASERVDELDPNWRACALDAQVWSGSNPSPSEWVRLDDASWRIHAHFDGRPLDTILEDAQPGIDETLAILGAVARLIEHLHAASGVHGNLSPASILWSAATGQVALADAGFASIPGMPGISHPEAGTRARLLYQSPEGTGRLGVPVDERSDLYSLGAILFEMLVGEPPFPDSSVLEIVHAHLAREPESPGSLAPGIPDTLSAVVMKLLAKLPEERYRSAAGVAADLEHCRNLTAGGGRRFSLVLGARDVPSRLRLSPRLYGRADAEVALLGAFDWRRETPGRSMVLIAGYAGMGKTSLVSSLQRRVAAREGYFAGGKFEQHTRRQPYQGLASAFRHLCRQVLSLPERELEDWRARITDALGSQLVLLVDLVPELARLSTTPHTSWAVDADEARWWFVQACRRLVRVFAGPSAPLVLFLDDLQWMDDASRELIQELLTDRGLEHLLFVGAYRDNEIESGSALESFLDSPPRVETVRVQLGPLGRDDIARFIEDSLVRTNPAPARVAEALANKTGGNPLYLRQFIESLERGGALRHSGDAWSWDLDAIETLNVTDNRGELLARSIEHYPRETRVVLQTLACLSGEIGLDLLAAACQIEAGDCTRRLRRPLAEGVVVRERADHADARDRYRFSHDKIAQQAYESMEASDRACRHAGLAALLRGLPGLLERRPFAVVEQLDRAAGIRPASLGDDELVDVFLDAASRSRDNTAFTAAGHYLGSCADLLSDVDWEDDYPRKMRWHQLFAEVAYQNGNHGESRSAIYEALEHAKGVEDVATLYSMLIVQNTRVGLDQEAIDQGAKALETLGLPLPERPYPAALERALEPLESIDIENEYHRLLETPMTTDARFVKAMSIMMELVPPSFFKEPILNQIIAARMTSLSLEHGVAPSSPKGIINYGAALAEHGRYREGYLWGRLAVDLADRHGLGQVKPRVLYTLAGGLNHWMNHLRTTPEIVDEGFRLSTEHGERDYGSYLLALGRCQNEYFLGHDVAGFLSEVEKILQHVEETGNALSTGVATAAYLGLSHLVGETESAGTFDRGEYSERALLQSSAAPRRRLVVCFFHLIKAHNLFFLEDFAGAREAITRAKRASTHMAAPMGLAILELISALLDAEDLRHAAPCDDGRERIETIRSGLARMRRWADDCPDNFAHLHALIEGELHRIEGRHEDAVQAFIMATEAARASGYFQFEGLAHRYLARHWSEAGRDYYAQHHLWEALGSFERWGASRVVDRLRSQLGEADGAHRSSHASPPRGRVSEPSVDLLAMMEMMRRISGDVMDFDVLKRDMALSIARVAGAQRALLFLVDEGRLQPVLGLDTEGTEEELGRGDFPETLVNLAGRSGEDVSIEDEAMAAEFARDPYLDRIRPRSAFAMTLKHHGLLQGVIYVENRINRMDTSADRKAVLDLLSGQAALSIRNAMLYGKLENEVRDRTRRLDSLNAELATRVEAQAKEIARLGHFQRFLSPQVVRALEAEGGWNRLRRHRGEVAIVFCDLRGFSAFSGNVASEEEDRMLGEYRRELEDCFARHEATVDHWAGDGAMVFLGDPFPPDPPSRSIIAAVELALDMRSAVSRLIESWRAHGHTLGFGVGITYGWATMGLIGEDSRMDYTARGGFVNLCSRLCDLAEDGQILVAQRVVAEIKEQYRVEHVDAVALKGFAEPVEVFDISQGAEPVARTIRDGTDR